MGRFEPTGQVDLPAVDQRSVVQLSWGLLPGARGPSDGSGGAGSNVPSALSVLRHAALYTNLPAEIEEAFAVLERHVMTSSEGGSSACLYPVAVSVVPFLLETVRRDSPLGSRIADLIARYVTLAGTLDAPMRDHLREIVGDHAGEIATWLGHYDRAAAALAIYIPAVRGPLVAAVARATVIAPEVLLALVDLNEAPGSSIGIAAAMIADANLPRHARMAAAAFLARYGEAAPDVRSRIDALLPPSAPAALARFVGELWRPTVQRPVVAPRLHDAEVVFAGERLVLVRAGQRSVTLPWLAAGLRRGDTLKVGLTTHGEPKLALLTAHDGSVRVIDF